MAQASSVCASRRALRVTAITPGEEAMSITAVAVRRAVRCPACHRRSARVHSRYGRTVADLPWWQGPRVVLTVTVRRSCCDRPSCLRRIFAEPVPKTVARYARRTTRTTSVLEPLGLAVGGRGGARLAARIGCPCAPGTVIAH
jgi:hypothetical protein